MFLLFSCDGLKKELALLARASTPHDTALAEGWLRYLPCLRNFDLAVQYHAQQSAMTAMHVLEASGARACEGIDTPLLPLPQHDMKFLGQVQYVADLCIIV